MDGMFSKYVFRLCAVSICLFSITHCEDILTEPNELKELDHKITLFLKGPTKEGWEDNLKDIDIFLTSMKNMIMVLNGTLPGLSKEFLGKVKEFYKNEKPLFIDLNVVEYELQPVIKVSDEDFTRLCWLRIYCEKDWELIEEMLRNREKIKV